MSVNELFRKFSSRIATYTGSPWAFTLAAGIILTWGLSGPVFQFSDKWQLVINSFTTIVTFLMVFLIQNTQNRDSKALHLKLDELLRASGDSRNRLIDLEDCSDEELERLQKEFAQMHEENDDATAGRLAKDFESAQSKREKKPAARKKTTTAKKTTASKKS